MCACYENACFSRVVEIHAACAGSVTEFANGTRRWRIELDPGASWLTCLLWTPRVGEAPELEDVDSPCHSLLDRDSTHDQAQRDWAAETTTYLTSDPTINAVVRNAIADLAGLRLHVHDPAAASWGDGQDHTLEAWVPAAGIPWFFSLFGRDTLVVSLQTLALVTTVRPRRVAGAGPATS